MSLAIGSRVRILDNHVHPKLAGRTGVLVHITQPAKCYGPNGTGNSRICGGNPIVEIAGVGRVLVPTACVVAIADEEEGERAWISTPNAQTAARS